jgi:cyclin L
MNDCLRLDVFLRYTPETIACACIYLSARELQIPLPINPAWFLIFGAKENDLKAISIRLLHLYSHKTVSKS